MNSFLVNMINRHQDRVEKVQPRIRSMFEPEPGVEFSGDHAFATTEKVVSKKIPETRLEHQELPNKPAIMEKSFHEYKWETTPPTYQQQPAENHQCPEIFDRPSFDENSFNSINERINNVLAQFAEKSESPQSSNDPNGPQNPNLSGTWDQTAGKNKSDETGLNHLIEETLRRLLNQTGPSEEKQSGFENQGKLLPHDSFKFRAEPSLPSIPPPVTKVGELSEPSIKTFRQPVQAVDNPKNGQEGSLQVPAWLTNMQKDLNNRWRKINAESQAEPVINVTIGRVEVRAVNTESEKPAGVNKKSIGVMTLEDYLKQREKKGRT